MALVGESFGGRGGVGLGCAFGGMSSLGIAGLVRAGVVSWLAAAAYVFAWVGLVVGVAGFRSAGTSVLTVAVLGVVCCTVWGLAGVS